MADEGKKHAGQPEIYGMHPTAIEPIDRVLYNKVYLGSLLLGKEYQLARQTRPGRDASSDDQTLMKFPGKLKTNQ